MACSHSVGFAELRKEVERAPVRVENRLMRSSFTRRFSPHGPLGIMMLENTPMPFLGCMGNPATFEYPVVYRTAPGAWANAVMAGELSLTHSVQATARQLVADGAVALTTNCGFFARYQHAITAAVEVPVAASSLALLPLLTHLVGGGGRIGIVTADSRLLRPELLTALGLLDDAPIAIVGIEGSPSWQEMQRPAPAVDLDQLRSDALDSIWRLQEQFWDLRCLLLECTGLGPCSAEIRERTGLPVYDAVATADFLMASVPHGPKDASAH